jgi:hypothetical protein
MESLIKGYEREKRLGYTGLNEEHTDHNKILILGLRVITEVVTNSYIPWDIKDSTDYISLHPLNIFSTESALNKI